MALTTFNVFKKSAKEFGGFIPVWKYVRGKIMSGGSLPTDIEKGLYPSGAPVQINTADHTAKILRYFVVNAAVTSSDTTVQVKVGTGLPTLLATDIVMKAPATYATTGKSSLVGTITNGEGYDSFTIVANALGVLDEGDILIEAATASATAVQAVKPNALLENDIYVDADTFASSATGVYNGDVYADRINWAVPDSVKAALPQIFFDNSL